MYRKLEVERNPSLLADLEKFINNAKGKSFGFSAKKVILKNNKKAGSESDYFCSELIASAYKAMGIIPNTVKSSSIWPNDFSNERKLPLVNSALGQEMLIDFDL